MRPIIERRTRRKQHILKSIRGEASKPRLVVFRSNKYIYAQLVDDVSRKTLAAASDIKIKSGTKSERAQKVGYDIAEKALELNLTNVVFDRGGYKYHGRVKVLADSAREGGLKF